jgi:penicillin-binding protein 1B
MARKKRSAGMRKRLQRGFVVLALLLLVVAIVVVAVLGRQVTQQFEGRRWTLPARVYAQPIDLYAGQQLSSRRFADELERLGYLAVANPDRPGTYRRRGEQVNVYVREFRFADGPQQSRALSVGFAGNAIASLEDRQGRTVPVYRLDPLLIGSIFPIHGEDRIVVAPDEVPPLLPEALKAVEDRKFDTHHGVSPLAILRALFVNVRAGQIEQGGSTLTQQLVKSYFLDSRRTLRRKAEEAVMAIILESRFEKADIMNAYINEIYLGQDGRRAVHGFGLASQFYFGKPLAELELPEIALLVAVVRGPSYYDPRRQPERALERRNLVLRVLAEQGVVSAEDAQSAAKQPLGVAEAGRKGGSFYPAFLDLVRRQLRRDYEESDLTEAGLTVFSTLDPLLQQKAEDALAAELDRLDRSGPRAAEGLEGVVVVTAPQTGEIAALVGGRRASFDGFNRALDATRPIGSLAKPLVYLAALESGRYSPISALDDAPVDLKLPNGDRWKPTNFDKQLRGPVTMVRALTQSLNLPTVHMGLDVGLDNVARTFEELGLEERPAELPSMLLGATNLSPLDVAQMYNTLANGGFRSPLRAVRAVVDESGQALKAPELEVAEAVSPDAVYTLGRMLVEVMQRGTGRAASSQLPAGLVVAGKTGTSNDYRDSWFAGFSGSHLVVTWVGHDDNSPTGLTGTTGGLAVWSRLMGSIVTSSFEPTLPEALEHRWVDYFTGLETSPFCNGSAVSLPFQVGTLLEADPACGPNAIEAPLGDGPLESDPPQSRAPKAGFP